MARLPHEPGRKYQPGQVNRIYLVSILVLLVILVVLVFRRPRSNHAAEPDAGANQPTIPVQAASQTPPLNSRSVPPAGQPLPNPADASRSPAPLQPATAASPKVTELIAEAIALVNTQQGRIIEARDKLNAALLVTTDNADRNLLKGEMTKLSDKWLFGPTVYPGDTLCDMYQVKSGDALSMIGGRLKVPYEFLMQINGLRRPESLQAGRMLKVVSGPFHTKIDRSKFVMDLYLQDTYVRSFSVGLGKTGRETPTGVWKVKADGKLISPTWTDPDTGRTYKATDPDYPLGSRWIALEGIEGQATGRTGFAIHGTKSPEQIGTAGSRGCIRLHNGDAILVYNLLFPVYSRVTVLD